MKKIFVTLLAFAAMFSSCSSPYYPEYHDIVALGVESTSNSICDYSEGDYALSILSNMPYEATIISGHEWLKFKDTDSNVRQGNGNEVVNFHYFQNNNVKRMARLVLSAKSRRDTIKIKQLGREIELLEIHKESLPLFTMNDQTRMPVAWEGGEYQVRLVSSCMDHQLSTWSSDDTIVSGFRIDNKVLTFNVAENNEKQPRIVTIQVSYIDGWDEKHILEFTIRQMYNQE